MAFYTILTDIGIAKLANATALGTTVELTEIAVGNGGGVAITPEGTATALEGEVWRAALNSISIDPANANWIVAEGYIPSTDGGFTVREVGLFDVAGDMIAIGSYPDTYKPTLASGSAKDLYIKVIIEVSNAGTVELKIDPAVVLASRAYVDSEILSSYKKNQGYKNLVVNGDKRVNQQGSTTLTQLVNDYNFDTFYYDGTYVYVFVEDVNLRNGDYASSWVSNNTAEYQLVSNATPSSGLSAITTGWTDVANGGTFNLASVSGKHLWVRFSAGTDGLNALLDVQIELGKVPTNFEVIDIYHAEAKVMRHYLELENMNIAESRFTTSVFMDRVISFPVKMRAIPSFVLADISYLSNSASLQLSELTKDGFSPQWQTLVANSSGRAKFSATFDARI